MKKYEVVFILASIKKDSLEIQSLTIFKKSSEVKFFMESNAAYSEKNRDYLLGQVYELSRVSAKLSDKYRFMGISRAIPKLTEYSRDLKALDVDELSKMGNMGKDAAKLVHRVLQGESVEAIFGDPKGEGAGLAGHYTLNLRFYLIE